MLPSVPFSAWWERAAVLSRHVPKTLLVLAVLDPMIEILSSLLLHYVPNQDLGCHMCSAQRAAHKTGQCKKMLPVSVHTGRICLLIHSHNTCLLPSVQTSLCMVSATVGGIFFFLYDERFCCWLVGKPRQTRKCLPCSLFLVYVTSVIIP